MTENLDKATSLRPLYAARLADDLERNTAEQARLSSEMAALQEQLETLRHNRALLVHMQQALGDVGQSTSAEGVEASVPRQAEVAPGQDVRNGEVRPEAATKRSSSSRTAAVARDGSAPTLRDLVVSHLSVKGQPLSAIEVADGLEGAHPTRNIKLTVVRSTLEAMVAKGLVRRSKQGKNVFYTAVAAEADKNQPATA
ncbi:BlaI/MecI/CopY family transcriptional regulator [Streptomyces sp. NBC_01334]|uniref:BlaI/MecI/CopY family transcriptional regulator n=1 Tax=Streptomyces sp. NBC_01334 TaxID=2903827 RepID=UPI002E1531C7|nr:BlaI/MecI/CopY family transcriptional regulator [Streptomyces sp. NBC_01334]